MRTSSSLYEGSPTGTTVILSESIEHLVNCSFTFVLTGATTGTIKFDFSNEITAKSASDVIKWHSLASADVAVAAAGDYLKEFTNMGYKFIRAKYTVTTGTPTMKCEFYGKGV